ncbi:RAMP superfamily CRISPR-associated protein [Scytonema sp. NUACC26]|uniref:RAMP superfamily CRISPR-associated protein n=1 Tax=Scytonema sp. NUACC26 TaxID=3140176 RepID=UPI0034DC362F
MKAITFIFKTKQPILATSFQGDPNSDVSYSYIPGSMIRGVLIGRYLDRNGLHNTDIVTHQTIRRLFFDGTTRYLNAYLCSQQGKRTFPISLSWRKDKGAELSESEGIKIYDFSVAKPSDDELESPKAVGEYFWVEEGGYLRLYSVERRINIHNLRDRRKGRSAESEGEIFRYDAIDTGQTFQGVILCEPSDEQLIKELLTPSDIWLGGSRSAGYGHVQIIKVDSPVSWIEVEELPENRVNNNILKITLLSDLILRDECGQYVAIPPTQLLFEALGVSLSKPRIAYMDSTFIGGFNRKWGLPLPQVPAVKAGSVFIFENVQVSAEQIHQLETEGIGERRVEGFGRIAVNWRIDKPDFIAKKPEPKLPSRRERPQLQTQESRNLARQMGERILRQKLEQLLLAQIEPQKLAPNEMTNSQLSRLMIVARQALDVCSHQPLNDLLNQLPSNARSQYERTKIGGKPLKEKIQGWLEQPTEWIENSNLQTVAIADEAASLTNELALEYTLRLIMAIAKNAIKEKSDES